MTRMRKILLGLICSLAVGQTDAVAQPASAGPSILKLKYVTILVKDYDEALSWYTKVLGLKKVEDRAFGPDRRWIAVAPEGDVDTEIVLDKLSPKPMSGGTERGADSLGKETNWVFQVEDCRAFYNVLKERGVRFIKPPTDQPRGPTKAIFEDLYGNVYVAESRLSGPASAHHDSR